nr:hypothetical protein [Tanacetum cinerariifolium]
MDDEDSRALKRLSESRENKAAKKQKLDEEVEELKKHLMIVPNDDDDVYTKATPLALKVPIVDYEIYTKNNKPYYKIKRADQRFATTKPKNFSDDFLLRTLGAIAARRRRRVVIRDPEETTTPSTIIHSEAKFKDKGKGILVEEPKPLKKQAQIKQDEAYARELEAELNKNIDWDEPQTEAQSRKNMMIYLRNMAGFKMDYFKGMSYDDIRLIFEKKFNSNVAFLLKTKEQMDDEDNRALKRLSESQENKAAKKQKLDEEVEELKKHLMIVPNDDDDVYTKATPLALKLIMLVEKKYALTRFTLDQMLNNVRLEVEEESEVSLELLSFGVDAAEDFKENMLSDYCCQVKLMMFINAAKIN